MLLFKVAIIFCLMASFRVAVDGRNRGKETFIRVFIQICMEFHPTNFLIPFHLVSPSPNWNSKLMANPSKQANPL